jgi:hypothetical protein
VKRHGFGGVGQATHGQHNRLRAPGSVGASYPSRVFKGMRMAGRMGGENVNVQNLRVLKVVAEKNLLVIKDVFLDVTTLNHSQVMEVKVVDFNGKILEERLNFLIQYSQLNQIITQYTLMLSSS